MNSGSSHPGLWLKDRRIMLVSADSGKVGELNQLLVTAGYQVAEVDSARDVFDEYERFEPDLVLVDVALPDESGYMTCRALRQKYSGRCAPVIFITSAAETNELVHGLEVGGVDYLARPFQAAEVLARIRVHLRNRLRFDQLSKADSAKNRLLGMAAHDLRNPLASIRALTDFLRDGTVGPLAPQQQALINTIHQASQSMLDLVNELLDISVHEGGGGIRINPEPTSLDEIIEVAVNLNNLVAARKGSIIVVEGTGYGGKINIDGPKIRQVLDNLLNNAIKFSQPGSTVRVLRSCSETECTVAIQDDGPGIPAGEESRLFRDFGVTSVKPTAGETSTGLGLAICQNLIKAHGGTIRARNLPQGGAEFSFTLPRAA